jgi:hypothetical protein
VSDHDDLPLPVPARITALVVALAALIVILPLQALLGAADVLRRMLRFR